MGEMDVKAGGIRSYVVAGATLSCSQGDETSELTMPNSHGVFLKGKPLMNTMDFKPYVNIQPFGKCQSHANPAVASAGKPMPCTPMITMPWINGKDDQLVENFPALINQSTNMCMYCGTIRVEDDGQ